MNYNYRQNDNIPSELIFGIVGAIGCNRRGVIKTLEECVKPYQYEIIKISIPDIIRDLFGISKSNSVYDDISLMIQKGKDIRDYTQDNSILAKLAAEQINNARIENSTHKRIFVIDSLKHPDEIVELRAIYPQGFYLFAVHVNEEDQNKYLIEDCGITDEKKRNEIIQHDKIEDQPYCQQTRKAFYLADFFINQRGYKIKSEEKKLKNIDEEERLKNVLERFFKIIFGDPYQTPLFAEFAMFMAYAASARSADMSRQVGALICKDEEILSVGYNDCPKFGGGLYSPQYKSKTAETYDEKDGRDYMRGTDSNSQKITEIREKLTQGIQNINSDAMKKLEENIDISGISDLTEYGRAVHAEMEALLSCARRNVNVKGAKLFCTTFPCHICAKHIVASGIDEVYYIEPYPKSKAIEMHDDSITDKWEDWKDDDDKKIKVFFRPFIGVGPKLFMNLFSMNFSIGSKISRRENSGKVKWDQKESLPRIKLIPLNYLERELTASNRAYNKLNKKRTKLRLSDNSKILNRIKKNLSRPKGEIENQFKIWQKKLLE